MTCSVRAIELSFFGNERAKSEEGSVCVACVCSGVGCLM